MFRPRASVPVLTKKLLELEPTPSKSIRLLATPSFIKKAIVPALVMGLLAEKFIVTAPPPRLVMTLVVVFVNEPATMSRSGFPTPPSPEN